MFCFYKLGLVNKTFVEMMQTMKLWWTWY